MLNLPVAASTLSSDAVPTSLRDGSLFEGPINGPISIFAIFATSSFSSN